VQTDELKQPLTILDLAAKQNNVKFEILCDKCAHYNPSLHMWWSFLHYSAAGGRALLTW